MLNLHRVKLKTQLLLLITISSVMLGLLLVFYYVQFHQLAEERGNDYTSRIMDQIEERLLLDARVMKDAALAAAYNTTTQEYFNADDPVKRMELNEVVLEILYGIRASNKNIKSIMLYDRKGSLVGASIYPGDYWLFRELLRRYAFDREDFIDPLYTDIISNPAHNLFHYAYITPVFSTHDRSGPFQKIAVCIVVYHTDSLDSMISNMATTDNSFVAILDKSHTVVATNHSERRGTVFNLDEMRDIIDAKEYQQIKNNEVRRVKYGDDELMFQKKDLRLNGWKMISLVPTHDLTNDVKKIRNVGFLIGMIMVLLIFAMGYLFNRNVTLPIEKMVHFTRSMRERYTDRRLDIKEQNEMGVLAAGINKMLDTISEVNRQYVHAKTSLYQTELAKKQAELSALQSQINPHFLYNTLECIRSIGTVYGSEEIVKISTAMAHIFRYNIKEDNMVCVQDEMECVRQYLSIMSIRYWNKFEIDIHIEQRLLHMKMLKMTLQPIVENAIYHGLERKSGKGKLSVNGYRKDPKTVCFEIEDNGIGLDEQELDRLRRLLDTGPDNDVVEQGGKRSIGLVNIHMRIRLYFGKPYGLHIDSQPNRGTKVMIRLPLIDENAKTEQAAKPN